MQPCPWGSKVGLCSVRVLGTVLAGDVAVQSQGHRKFPRHIAIQSDNTVAQAKNQWVLLWLALLVKVGCFETATLNFLRVGHTHEDIDQFFSLVVSLILRCPEFQSATELLTYLEAELQPKFQAKSESLCTQVVSGVRSWQSHLCLLHRSIEHCLANRQGMLAPHSFTFKLGSSLRPSEKNWQGPGSRPQSSQVYEAGAVYALVKAFMSSGDLIQEPALVLPADRALAELVPMEPAPRLPLTETKIKAYTKLALKCADYGLNRARSAVEDLLFDASYVLPPLAWLSDGDVKFRWRDYGQIADVHQNPFFPHLPNSFILISKDRR
jgi:hypothetical protein